MERRSWPWKKRSSEKSPIDKSATSSDSASASLSKAASLGSQDYKKVNYVQITLETYQHLNGLEDQIKTIRNQITSLESQAKDLQEKLSAAESEIRTKENLVQQHAKVAEDAVSGWEKADSQVIALQHQVESMTSLMHAAEDRASHLDGALKECTRQIRNTKEESELKLQEVILTKTKQWDKMKLDLEAKIGELDHGLLRAAAQNAALLRSLDEHLSSTLKINEEKSQVETENELLKGKIQLYEKEVSSLKYEFHVVSKELDIRNEERNMNVKSAEAANRQHLEDIKKITKLEAECQRLRGLVRKKLPGPAALAQMKLEVESFGRESYETLTRKNAIKVSAAHLPQQPRGISVDDLQKYNKEIEILNKRLLESEEEKMKLKEALSACNLELQASRNVCAKTVCKLKGLEAQIQVLNNQRRSPSPNLEIHAEDHSSHVASAAPSVVSLSEDGVDEEGSSIESWGTVISDTCEVRKENNMHRSREPSAVNHIELMDDFLEMERLACLSNNLNMNASTNDNESSAKKEDTKEVELVDAIKDVYCHSGQKHGLLPSKNDIFNQDSGMEDLKLHVKHLPFPDVLSRISTILESHTDGMDGRKVLNDIKQAMLLLKTPPLCSVNCSPGNPHPCSAMHFGGGEVLKDQKHCSTSEPKVVPCSDSVQEVRNLNLEKDDGVVLTSSCAQDLENLNIQLLEKEQLLAALRSQLESSEKSHTLAEVQLKCVTEGYKSLEMRAHDFEAEVALLHKKIEELESELTEERHSHQNTKANFAGLQHDVQRKENCLWCSSLAEAGSCDKAKQGKDIAEATGKLAECQETIYLLKRQLQALHPCTEMKDSQPCKKGDREGCSLADNKQNP